MPIVEITDLNESYSEVINLDCRSSFVENISMSLCEVSTIMPFRIRFTTIDAGAYSPSNPAPIGIAVLGFNNYIL